MKYLDIRSLIVVLDIDHCFDYDPEEEDVKEDVKKQDKKENKS